MGCSKSEAVFVCMKWIIMIWVVVAGIGVSVSILKERNERLVVLREMQEYLEKLNYYMYHFKMPLEESVRHVSETGNHYFKDFLEEVGQALRSKSAEHVGTLWQEKSQAILQKSKLPKEAERIWTNLFLDLPGDPEILERHMAAKAEELKQCKDILKVKYMGEQKMVLVLGALAGAFFCLILW